MKKLFVSVYQNSFSITSGSGESQFLEKKGRKEGRMDGRETKHGPVMLSGIEAFLSPVFVGKTPTSVFFPEFIRADAISY